MEVAGQCDAVLSIKRIIAGICKAGEGGAGVEVSGKTVGGSKRPYDG